MKSTAAIGGMVAPDFRASPQSGGPRCARSCEAALITRRSRDDPMWRRRETRCITGRTDPETCVGSLMQRPARRDQAN